MYRVSGKDRYDYVEWVRRSFYNSDRRFDSHVVAHADDFGCKDLIAKALQQSAVISPSKYMGRWHDRSSPANLRLERFRATSAQVGLGRGSPDAALFRTQTISVPAGKSRTS